MTSNEVIMFYLNNLAHAKLSHKHTESVLDFVEEMSVDLLGYDICDKWGIKVGRFSGYNRAARAKEKAAEEDAPKCVRSLCMLKNILANCSIVNITALGEDKFIDSMTELFELTNNERRVLQLFACIARFAPLRNLAGELLDCRRFGFHPNVNETTALAAFCGMAESTVQDVFSPNGTLLDSGILSIDDDGEIILNRFIQRAAAHNICDAGQLKADLLGAIHRGDKNLSFSHVQDEYDYVKTLIDSAVRQKISGINILIYGATGTGKTAMTRHIVSALGYDLYGLHTSNKCKQEKAVNLSYLMYAQRILRNDNRSVIMLDEAEDVFAYNRFSSSAMSKLALNQVLERNARPVIWLTNDIDCVDPAYLRRFTYCMELKKPNEEVKKQIWTNICNTHQYQISDADIAKYVRKYDVAPAVIDNAVRAAKLTGMQTAIPNTIDALVQAMTGRRPVDTPTSGIEFDTGLLNTDIDMEKLTQQLVAGKCKNFSLCLYGASGTGKSAFARHLAQQLKIPIIHKRASDLRDKYVGETEKRIAAAFAEAAARGAMLVFDEADSFLRDRTKANAGWEVSATNEMLTQMEAATVPFICTTNLMSDIDSASLRRFLFKIKYEYMTPNQVRLAFKKFFDMTPADGDIRHLTHMSPADFVVVQQKSKVLGITDAAEIIKMLESEMAAKNIKCTRRIGFQD